MRVIKNIIVHYSASSNSLHDNIDTIDRWHKEKGWDGVGYHYFIQRNGTIQYGRPLDQVGAHTKGFNEDSIGICMSGKYAFTYTQKRSLARLCQSLRMTLGPLDVHPHNYFNRSTPCPNFDLSELEL